MPFNSFDFIFVFLPLCIVGYYLVQKYFGKTPSLVFLLGACFVFYGWWDPGLIWVIFASIGLNFFCNVVLTTLDRKQETTRFIVLIFGVGLNLSLIAYYKYFFFLGSIVDDAFSTSFNFSELILPLGISFFTFQQIAFLVDTWGGHVKRQSLLHYALFVTFFPQLIAGPIVRHDELLPQFRKMTLFSNTNLSIGLTFFIIGLVKKVLIADNLALFATPVFVKAEGGTLVSFVDAWGAALAYTFQLYFDISGYADMAVGLGRIFGIRIPLNFNSPMKAKSIIDFWQRWHLTLTHFLTGYCYNPITLKVTRYRAIRRLPGLRGGVGTPGAFLSLLAMPTMITMTLAGIWHGAGYQFIVFGFLHGLFLVLNHAWRGLMHSWHVKLGAWAKSVLTLASVALTFSLIVALFVPFRSGSMDSAINIWQGMMGMNGIVLRESYASILGPIGPVLQSLVGLEFSNSAMLIFKGTDQVKWLAFALFICWALPNTQEFMARYLVMKDRSDGISTDSPVFHSYAHIRKIPDVISWKPNVFWAILATGASIAIVNKLTSTSEFLYFQF
ncbi:MBOAT family O-acyltransferase [Magnetovibrio sp. PR-2]|uniref:MBOAT family O-acyltransferase n=1 Tax=Magnetovibrio sp. PR-2 TaxID=3120356 RepID=UPI002FCE2F82